ncbi:CHAP domain-containing protein [Pseudoalteromonas piscicida]|uniref:CHAP domain-containing protein n=1 Tax=Pseudoalteromonas piscicida TaxID=43662 RepID=UPI0032C0F167
MKNIFKILMLILPVLLTANANARSWQCAEWVGNNHTAYYDFRSTDAYRWYDYRDDKGYEAITRPVAGSVIVVNPHSDNGNSGHVMHVDQVVAYTDQDNYTVYVSHANKDNKGKVYVNDYITISSGLYRGKYSIRGIIKPKKVQLTVYSKEWESSYLTKDERSKFTVSLRNNGSEGVYPADLELAPVAGNSARYFSTHIDSANPRIDPNKTVNGIDIYVRPSVSTSCTKPKWNIVDKATRDIYGTIHFTTCIRVY